MLNKENATRLFELATDLLQHKSSYLALYSAVNNSEKLGLSVAATTVDGKGQIIYEAHENKSKKKVHASLEIKDEYTRYLVEVKPSDPDRMSKRYQIDNYAITKFDDERRHVYSTFHENNVDHDNSDIAAIELFDAVAARGLASIDPLTQVSLPQIRGSVKNVKPELPLTFIHNDHIIASFTKKEITHALDLFNLFKFTTVMSGSELPRE